MATELKPSPGAVFFQSKLFADCKNCWWCLLHKKWFKKKKPFSFPFYLSVNLVSLHYLYLWLGRCWVQPYIFKCTHCTGWREEGTNINKTMQHCSGCVNRSQRKCLLLWVHVVVGHVSATVTLWLEAAENDALMGVWCPKMSPSQSTKWLTL